jgi:hypothetical protein
MYEAKMIVDTHPVKVQFVHSIGVVCPKQRPENLTSSECLLQSKATYKPAINAHGYLAYCRRPHTQNKGGLEEIDRLWDNQQTSG